MKSINEYLIGKNTKIGGGKYHMAWYHVQNKSDFKKLRYEINCLSFSDRDFFINKVGDCLQFSKTIGIYNKYKDAVQDAYKIIKQYPIDFQLFVIGIIKNEPDKPESLDFEYITYKDSDTGAIIELDNVF